MHWLYTFQVTFNRLWCVLKIITDNPHFELINVDRESFNFAEKSINHNRLAQSGVDVVVFSSCLLIRWCWCYLYFDFGNAFAQNAENFWIHLMDFSNVQRLTSLLFCLNQDILKINVGYCFWQKHTEHISRKIDWKYLHSNGSLIFTWNYEFFTFIKPNHCSNFQCTDNFNRIFVLRFR